MAGLGLLSLYSNRSYTVPDPPGLFDGHVWPMYHKYKREMEQDGVDVGKCQHQALSGLPLPLSLTPLPLAAPSWTEPTAALIRPFPVSVYLDGTKSQEVLFRQVLEDVQNRLLNRS